MLYEPYVKKKKVKKRRGCLSRLFRLALGVLAAVLILYVAINLISAIDLTGNKAALSVNGKLPGGWTNILLLGADMEEEGASRTDTMIIASIGGGGQVKLSSIMRDTMVRIDGHGTAKINAAYRYGGAELAMKTVNEAFAMNITHYAIVDFSTFPYLIDTLGGIEIDVSKREMEQINKNVHTAVRDMGGQKSDVVYLDTYGEGTHLNGAQALGYARIRSIDSDYMRTQRQRTVLNALLKKARGTRDPIALISFAGAALSRIDTNLDMAKLVSIGTKVLLNDADMREYRVPAEGTYESGTYDGVWGIKPDVIEMQKGLLTFIYGS